MKKLLLLCCLLSSAAQADVFDLKITQENFYCTPNKLCTIYADFDVMIVNETDKTQRYYLGYNLQIPYPWSVSSGKDKIDVPPRGTFKHHYHHDWQQFVLSVSDSYLLNSYIGIRGQVSKTQTSTIWVY